MLMMIEFLVVWIHNVNAVEPLSLNFLPDHNIPISGYDKIIGNQMTEVEAPPSLSI